MPRTHAGSVRTCWADLGNVCLRSQADHDVQFLQLHVDRVVVLHKEHLDFLLQDFRPEGNIALFHPRLVKTTGSILTGLSNHIYITPPPFELLSQALCTVLWCTDVRITVTSERSLCRSHWQIHFLLPLANTSAVAQELCHAHTITKCCPTFPVRVGSIQASGSKLVKKQRCTSVCYQLGSSTLKDNRIKHTEFLQVIMTHAVTLSSLHAIWFTVWWEGTSWCT